MIDIQVLEDMAADGATIKAIIAYIDRTQKREQEKAAKKKEQARQRQKNRRLKVASQDVTQCPRDTALQDEKSNENNNRVTQSHAPPHTPYIESNNIIDSTAARLKKGIPTGYVSHDGTVQFTAAEIEKLSIEFRFLPDVLGTATHLIEEWACIKVVPENRKRAVISTLRKMNAKSAALIPKDKTAEKNLKQVAVNDSDAAFAEQRRALEFRRRHYGGGNAG